MIIDLKQSATSSLQIGAQILIDCGDIENLNDLLYFMEKPWKFAPRLKEIVEEGYADDYKKTPQDVLEVRT